MMSSDWRSDDSSTIASPQQSIRQEVAAVAEVIQKERIKGTVTIGVAREPALENLEKKCEYGRSWFGKPPPTFLTTAEYLQDTIDNLKLSDKRRTLNLLVSSQVPEISFDVPSHFSQLKVLRCALRRDGGTLFIDGESTYNNVCLDKWQAHRHTRHTLIIGHERGVRIRLSGITNLPNWSRCRSNFSDEEQENLRQHFDTLSSRSRWDEVKGTVAAVVGIAVGTTKFSMAVSGAVGGIYAKYTFGLHAFELGAAGAKLTTVATAAGPAVVLGVTAAAAVYFIPWEGLWNWLKSAFSWLWDKICQLWDRFKSWVMSLFSSESSEKTTQRGLPRPMAFSG